MADRERESRKRKLKQRVIIGSKSEERAEEESREEERKKTEENPLSLSLKGFWLPFLLILFLLFVIGFFFYGRRRFRQKELLWKENSEESKAVEEEYRYFPYKDGVIKLSKDGAKYISSQGKVLWNQAFEMGRALVSVTGEYAVIGEQGGTKLYILSSQGLSGQGEAPSTIEKLRISEKGVVYALLTEDRGTYITVFSKEGKNLDIGIKSVMAGDGYPLDMSVSPDGTELCVAFSHLEQTSLKSRVVFYNFSSLGKNAGADRVVGGFTDDFASGIVGRVHFFTDEESFAAYDGGVAFFSTKVRTSPELKKKVDIPETIRMIAYDQNYLAVLTDQRGEALEDTGKAGGKDSTKEGKQKSLKKKKQSPVLSGSTLEGTEESAGQEKNSTESANQESFKQDSTSKESLNKEINKDTEYTDKDSTSKESASKESRIKKDSSGGKKKKQEKPYRLLIFRKTGEKILDKPIDFMGSNMELSQDKVILYQEKNYKVYDFQGRLRYNGETEEGLQYIRSLSKIQFSGTDLFLAYKSHEEAIRVK